jgi:regulator of sigma E protease
MGRGQLMDSILNLLHQGSNYIFPFIILLGLLIFVHELGHFLVAKYFGVRVEVFSLGFGRKIFSRKHGDTTYAISMIPLGGYVKMFGDEMGAELPEEEKKYSFLHKPVLQRMAVVLAGPLMNLFFAIFLYFIIVMSGEKVVAPVVGDIHIGTAAFTVGFRSGDRVTEVNGKVMHSWNQMQEAFTEFIGRSVNVRVKHQMTGDEESLTVYPTSEPDANVLSLRDFVGSVQGLTNQSLAPFIGIANEDSLWTKSGLKTGDLIEKIDGIEVKSWVSLQQVLLNSKGKNVEFELERVSANSEKDSERLKIKVALPADESDISWSQIESSELYLAKVIENLPSAKAGFLAGDKLLKINGKSIVEWDDLQNAVKTYQEGQDPLSIVVLRKSQELEFKVQPQLTDTTSVQGLRENRYAIGVVPWLGFNAPVVERWAQDNIWSGIKRSIEKTYEITAMTLLSFSKLFKAQISAKNIGGIISIGQAASETFKMGWIQFITMMALVSVNLFVLNLLPVPVLDGGHLVFYTIELLKGSPLSLKKMELAQRFGMVVLMSLMVFALFNDVTRLISNW